VFLNDHVTEINADAEPDAALFVHVRLTVDHSSLELHGASHRIHHARELGQQAVAGVLHDAAPVLLDLGVNQFTEVGLEPRVRPFLVGAHQPRITGHVGGKDGGETAGRGHGRGRPPWSKVRFG